LDNRDADHLA
jgi:hypothetical protein